MQKRKRDADAVRRRTKGSAHPAEDTEEDGKVHLGCLARVMETLIGWNRADRLEKLRRLLWKYESTPEHDRLPVAREISEYLDPSKATGQKSGSKPSGQWPEKLALVNGVAKNAFELRFIEEQNISCVVPVFHGGAPKNEKVLDRTLECGVCDAICLKSVSIKIIGKDKNELNSGAKISLMADGERVLDAQQIKDLMALPEDGRLARDDKRLLYTAHLLKPGRIADLDAWVGHMLTNGTKIEVEVSSLEPEKPESTIEVTLSMALYSTKDANGGWLDNPVNLQ